MLSELERKVADYAGANELFGSTRRLLLAVSGGADSTALLHVMHALKATGELNAEFHCAHVNHRLRGADAEADEEFVVSQAAGLNMPSTSKRLDVRGYARRNKLSIETAARQLRIRTLTEIAGAANCDAIVTAHQKDDNAETVIQRLARGTGFRGLAGIWPVRVFADGTKFIRPLLCVGRDEIISYLRDKDLEWRRDRTNSDCTHRRNYIRHRLLPELQRNCTGSIAEQLSELARSARGFYRLIHERVNDLWPEVADCAGEEVVLDLAVFLSQARPAKIEIIRRSLTEVGCGQRDLTRRHYEYILQLADGDVTSHRMELPGSFVVYRERGGLVLGPARNQSVGQAPPCVDERHEGSAALEMPGKARFGAHLIEATILDVDSSAVGRFRASKTDYTEWVDLGQIKAPLCVRRRRPGDRFVPLGSRSEKKIGKFLTAQRVPRRLRSEALVVADAEKIIWVCPLRISDRVKVTSETRKVLQLRASKTEAPQNSVATEEPDR